MNRRGRKRTIVKHTKIFRESDVSLVNTEYGGSTENEGCRTDGTIRAEIVQDGTDWLVEDTRYVRGLNIDEACKNHSVYVNRVSNSQLGVEREVKKIRVADTQESRFYFMKVREVLELYRCKRISVQIMKSYPTRKIQIDGCEGVKIYLSKSAFKRTKIIIGTSSAITIELPNEPPIKLPESLIFKYDSGNKLQYKACHNRRYV